MIFGFKQLIKMLYNKYVEQNSGELEATENDVNAYRDITKENIIAIMSKSIATLALSDSTVTIDGENERAMFLNNILQRHFKKRKRIVSDALGTGMIASIPRVENTSFGAKIYIDTVAKDNIFITGTRGDEITQITTVSELKEINNVRYLRFTDYALENGNYVIRQKAARNNSPYPIGDIEFWADIPEEIHISGVDRLPIGIFKCPVSNRFPNNTGGVPITYGCRATLDKIADTLEKIEKEYAKKQTKVFADVTLLDKNNKIDKDLFVSTNGGGLDSTFYQVYSPEIRSSAYFDKLTQHMALLEKQVGVSRGILTDMQTQGATATEIRRSMYQTFALCDDIQENFEQYISDLIYGINVLADCYNITAKGEYDIKYDWNYALMEDPEQTFNQMLQAEGVGAVSKAEIRSFVTSEDLKTAEEAVKKIEEEEPKAAGGMW